MYVFSVLLLVQIIGGITMLVAGIQEEKHLVLPGALLIISGSFLYYLTFGRSGKD